MVNWWPLQYVGLSRTNNKYRAVRAAAQNYATVLNKYPLPARTPNTIKEINAAKSNLQTKINRYMENIPASVPPVGAPPAAGPGFFNRFKRGAPPPPAAGPAPTPNANWLNGTAKNVPVKIGGPGTATEIKRVYREGDNYFANVGNGSYRKVILKTGPLGRFGRAGNRYYGYNNSPNAGTWAKGANNKFVRKANANAAAAKAEFTNFITAAARKRADNMNAMAKNYLNGKANHPNYQNVSVNWNKVRRITKNTNTNAATRVPFWNAVNAEMTRRAAPPPFKNLEAFKRYYTTRIMLNEPNNRARAQRYVREFNAANNAGKRAIGGAITKNNNNNANRKKNGGFWNLVGNELAARPSR